MRRGAGQALGRLAMVAGGCLVAGGLALRFGAVALPGADGPPEVVATSPGPAASGGPAAPTAAQVVVATAAPPTTSPPLPSTTPSATVAPGTPWFADDFETVAAWPTGDLDWLTAEVVDGRYRVEAQATDLPVVVLAAAGDGSPGADVAVGVRLEIMPAVDPTTAAGIALETVDGTRFLILLSADGRVTLYRDSIESFDGLASGTTTPPTGLAELRVTATAGTLTATVDSLPVVSARVTVVPVAVGLAVWVVGGPATVEVDRYEVWWLDGGG